MRRTTIIILLLLALTLNMGAGLRAVGETPPEKEELTPNTEPEVLGPYKPPITTGPDNSALYEKAAAYTGGESLSARLGDPEHVERSFASSDGSLTVDVDADVVVPEADAAPLIRVRNGTITQAQADVLLDALVHCTLYDPVLPHTRAELEEYLQQLEGILDDQLESGVAPENGPDAVREEIAAVEKELKTAPETVEPQPIDGRFKTDDIDGALYIRGEGESEEYGPESIQIRASQWLGGSRALYTRGVMDDSRMFHFVLPENWERTYEGIDLDAIEDVTIDAGQARALCDPIVEALGIEDMRFQSALKMYAGEFGGRPDQCCWVLQYGRAPGGLPITYTTATGDAMTDGPVYQQPWLYETMTFYVDDSGVAGLWWESPYEMGEHVTEDAALLPFDEAMAIFQKLLTVAWDGGATAIPSMSALDNYQVYEARQKGHELRVHVDEIRLGYTRIAEMDKTGVGLLVPAWDFFGTVTDENGAVVFNAAETSFLTINAVDGDIIDRGFGY